MYIKKKSLETDNNLNTIQLLLSAVSFSILTVISIVYITQPDYLAPITYWLPVWVWPIIGIATVLPCIRKDKYKLKLILIVLWLGFLFVFAEEPTSIYRSALQKCKYNDRHYIKLRVITLNCECGNMDAALEAAKYHPDIFLLQESPSRDCIRKLGIKLFGKQSYAWGTDASIIANGKFSQIKLPSDESLFSNYAAIKMKSGINLQIVSLRLLPASFSTDIFSKNYWQQQESDKIARKNQLRTIIKHLKSNNNIPTIIGGDFNSPAIDNTSQILSPYLYDSFTKAGTGWGNTILNDIPLQRIDKIWLSRDIKTISCRAYKTHHSDHRIVVCDILISKRH